MRNYSIFDIVGPVMIGPSSSHTAGAAKIASVARKIAGRGFYRVDFDLHGSFASTYQGHGTDKALVAGIIGLDPSDEKIRDSFELARKMNLEVHFHLKDLGDVHPNTVQIRLTYPEKIVSITGASIGGGNILITQVDGVDMEYTMEYPLVIFQYTDCRGIISKITGYFSEHGYNIETIKTVRKDKEVSLLIELNKNIKEEALEELKEKHIFKKIMYIEKRSI